MLMQQNKKTWTMLLQSPRSTYSNQSCASGLIVLESTEIYSENFADDRVIDAFKMDAIDRFMQE